MTQPVHFFIQHQAPGGRGRARWGITDEGWYLVEDGNVILTDSGGSPRLNYEGQPRSAPLGENGNARQVAARLLREALSNSDRPQGFGRALNYGPSGVA
jgi:hypothetical protein